MKIAWPPQAMAAVVMLQARCCLAATDAAASAPLVFKPDANPDLPSAPHWMLAALVCVAALWIGVEVLRRRGKMPALGRLGGRRLLSVEERMLVAPQVHLVVARYGSRRLLLAAGPQGVQCLRDDDEQAVDGEATR